MVATQKAVTLLLAMGLCLIPLPASAATPAAAEPAASPAAAAVAPIAPAPVAPVLAVVTRPPAPVHKFFDSTNVMMQGIGAALMAADIASTNRSLQVPGSREANPLMQSAASRYALKIAAFGAGMGVAYMMHKTGHHKAERIVPLIFGVPSGVAAAHNAGIHR